MSDREYIYSKLKSHDSADEEMTRNLHELERRVVSIEAWKSARWPAESELIKNIETRLHVVENTMVKSRDFVAMSDRTNGQLTDVGDKLTVLLQQVPKIEYIQSELGVHKGQLEHVKETNFKVKLIWSALATVGTAVLGLVVKMLWK